MHGWVVRVIKERREGGVERTAYRDTTSSTAELACRRKVLEDGLTRHNKNISLPRARIVAVNSKQKGGPSQKRSLVVTVCSLFAGGSVFRGCSPMIPRPFRRDKRERAGAVLYVFFKSSGWLLVDMATPRYRGC